MATSAEQIPPAPSSNRPGDRGPTGFQLVENEIGGGVTLVQVVGELDAAVVGRLIELLEGIPESQETVVIALDECEFIDSSGIAAILRFRRQLLAQSRRLFLCAPRGQVLRVLEITGVAVPELVGESLDELPLGPVSD